MSQDREDATILCFILSRAGYKFLEGCADVQIISIFTMSFFK